MQVSHGAKVDLLSDIQRLKLVQDPMGIALNP